MPGKKDYSVVQGETFLRTVYIKVGGVPVNLTGYTAKMEIRDPAAGGVDPAAVTLEDGSGITLGTTGGDIALEVDSAATAALPLGKYDYDLRLTSGTGIVLYLLAGSFTVSRRVTT